GDGGTGARPAPTARRLLPVEDESEGHDHGHHQQHQQDLHAHRNPHEPAGAVRALAALLAVGGVADQLVAAAVAVGLVGNGHGLIITLTPWKTRSTSRAPTTTW